MANRPFAHLTSRAPSHVFPGPLRRPGWILRGAHPRRRNRQVAHTYQETNGGRRTTFRAGCVLIRAIQRTRPFPTLFFLPQISLPAWPNFPPSPVLVLASIIHTGESCSCSPIPGGVVSLLMHPYRVASS